MELTKKKCVPCKGGTPSLSEEKARELLKQTAVWELKFNQLPNRIVRTFEFKNFKEVMAFLNKIAILAEQEGHHPDIEAHYKEVTLTFFTHAIGGLSENDFIMAAKVNQLAQ